MINQRGVTLVFTAYFYLSLQYCNLFRNRDHIKISLFLNIFHAAK